MCCCLLFVVSVLIGVWCRLRNCSLIVVCLLSVVCCLLVFVGWCSLFVFVVCCALIVVVRCVLFAVGCLLLNV